MPIFKFYKLVRDRIVEQQIASGAKPTFYQLASEEHKRRLVDKIIEEAKELTEADPNDVVAELADVQQAIDDLRGLYGVTGEAVRQAQAAKNERNGAFKKGLFVESVEVKEDNPWIEYYRKNADRYPEIE